MSWSAIIRAKRIHERTEARNGGSDDGIADLDLGPNRCKHAIECWIRRRKFPVQEEKAENDGGDEPTG